MNIIINELPDQETETEILSNSSLEDEMSVVDSTIAMEMDYSINYTLPMLHHICGFYNLSYSRVKKNDLVALLVEFEQNSENMNMVQERKRLWYYMQELKANKYLSKYIISM